MVYVARAFPGQARPAGPADFRRQSPHVQQSHTYLRGASDDGIWPAKAIPELKRRRQTALYTRFLNRPRDAYSDDNDLGQKFDDNGDFRDGTDSDGTDGGDTDSEEDYLPPLLEGSEGERDGEDDFGPPSCKRRKTVSAILATSRTAATQRICSSGPVSQEQNVQSLAHGGKLSSRRIIPTHPSSRVSHDGKGAVRADWTRYEEWTIKNGTVKCVTENGWTTLQIIWGPCEHAAETPCSESPAKKRNSTKRCPTTRAAITPDEDDLVIKLKEVDKLPWQEVHKRFTEAFPRRKRSVAAL
ncbi:hypothetical protein DL765_002732 [Monosporascus sp. GIB2]|nr:hypothetical protein DL765_002732 [Monosporascus sp. GIB2]